MRFSLTLATILAIPYAAVTVSAASAQVNFYYDQACKDYAGHAYPTPHRNDGTSGIPKSNVVGGPYGSRSMLWVYANADCDNHIQVVPLFCKNSDCSAADNVDYFGECKTFQNGVWAAYWEECPL